MSGVHIVVPGALEDVLSTMLGNGIQAAVLVRSNGSVLASAKDSTASHNLSAAALAGLVTDWQLYQSGEDAIAEEASSMMLDFEHGRMVLRPLRVSLLLIIFASPSTGRGFMSEKVKSYVALLNRTLPDRFAE